MNARNGIALALFIAVSEAAGIIGAVFTTPAIAGWYDTLVKPALAPPNWIFGPVWTTLFALMGVAAYLVWRKRAAFKTRTALTLFALQLALNTLWSILFFGLERPGLAFTELCILWLAILATIFAFARISRPAAWLLAPYLAWVTFAGYLNFMIWALNR